MEHAFVGGGILFFFAMIIFGLLAFVFWIWMLYDAITELDLSQTENIIWVVVIVFTGWIGALVYYIINRRNRDFA